MRVHVVANTSTQPTSTNTSTQDSEGRPINTNGDPHPNCYMTNCRTALIRSPRMNSPSDMVVKLSRN